MKNFVHPGGNYIIESLNGKDMARYLYGNQGLEFGFVPGYNHSVQALESLKSREIGEINDD